MGVRWPTERDDDIPREAVVAALPSHTVPAPREPVGRSSWESGAETAATPEGVVVVHLGGWDDGDDEATGTGKPPVEANRAGGYRPMYVVAPN